MVLSDGRRTNSSQIISSYILEIANNFIGNNFFGISKTVTECPICHNKNEHYNSNNTAESYLFELGYMDNYQDLLNILNNKNNYAEGIAEALQKYLDQE